MRVDTEKSVPRDFSGRFTASDVKLSCGDSALQYGLQHQFIDPFVLVLFLGGLAYSLTLIRNAGGQLLWIWFLGTLAAGGLLTIDAPFSHPANRYLSDRAPLSGALL